jgi:hypothetical protein
VAIEPFLMERMQSTWENVVDYDMSESGVRPLTLRELVAMGFDLEAFLDQPLGRALEVRADRARRLVALDEAVAEAVAALKERGIESPYLKAFVVARVNPLRSKKAAAPSWDEAIDAMLAKARAFDPGKIKAEQVSRTGGGGAD